jgi:hypothetical protein
LGGKALAIREAVLALTDEFEVMTVRQVFYQLVSRGVVPKSENGGYRPVQAQVLKMRRENLIPWDFIADGTRWQRKPESWDGVQDALRETARTYRRNLWRSQRVRVEVWLEKDALASVVTQATMPWDVGLMVSRGTSSATFLYQAAKVAEYAYLKHKIETEVFALYDYDAAGARAFRSVEQGLREHAPLIPMGVSRLAVTPEQIEEWSLPTRPAKVTDPEAHKFQGGAVELDAIPPDKLITLVDDAIVPLIDADAWNMEKFVEQSEREILERLVKSA